MPNLTTSLELSKKLKENGFPQVSYFYWSDWHKGVLKYGEPEELFRGEWRIVSNVLFNDDTKVSAPLAEEIGRELPLGVKTWKWKDLDGKVKYACERSGVFVGEADTMSDAMALAWLYLKVNGLITV